MDRVQKMAQSICRRVGSPFSRRIGILLEKGDWASLQEASVAPGSYGDAESYWADAMSIALVRKLCLPGDSRKRKLAAVNTFLETERDCCATNTRFSFLVTNSGYSVSDLDTLSFLQRWRSKMRYVFGRLPDELDPLFSGGSTTTTTSLESTIMDKMSTTPAMYRHSIWPLSFLIRSTGWDRIARERTIRPLIHSANEYFTVPKSTLTDRSCGMEASINMSYQLAAGRHIRRRLRQTLNIDLDHGAQLHRYRAYQGSIHGDLATIDLSAASDRWAKSLVRYLLPDGWLELLNSLRATHTSFGGRRLFLEKFSSMGNGFTFELETALFATLAHQVAEDEGISGEILCYGDDLIVPTALAIPLCSALKKFGHRVNQKKTFMDGPFRESCGGDFFGGVNVSLPSLEEIPEEPQHWISLANNLRRTAYGVSRRWALVLPLWRYCIEQIPQMFRVRGPTHLGDQVIHDSRELWTVSGSRVRVYQPVTAKRDLFSRFYVGSETAIVYYLSWAPGTHSRYVPLRKVAGYRLRWAPVDEEARWLPGDSFRVVDKRLSASRFTRFVS